jgi:hypothetical protein
MSRLFEQILTEANAIYSMSKLYDDLSFFSTQEAQSIGIDKPKDLIRAFNATKPGYELEYAGSFSVGGAQGRSNKGVISVIVDRSWLRSCLKGEIDDAIGVLRPTLQHELYHSESWKKSGGKSEAHYKDSDDVSWMEYATQSAEIGAFARTVVEELISKGYPLSVIEDILKGARPYNSGSRLLDDFRMSGDKFSRNKAWDEKSKKRFYKSAVQYIEALRDEGVNVEDPEPWDAYWKSQNKPSPRR